MLRAVHGGKLDIPSLCPSIFVNIQSGKNVHKVSPAWSRHEDDTRLKKIGFKAGRSQVEIL